MPKQNIEYTVTRSFDSNNLLLENLIEYIKETEAIEDDDGKPSNANSGDLLPTI